MRPIIGYLLLMSACAIASEEGTVSSDYKPSVWNELTPEQTRVIEHAGTERPGTGQFLNHHEDGTYTCARCRSPLFASGTKFESGCGWPSFDDSLPGAVLEVPDRTVGEPRFVVARCDGHLGHVFRGEGMTPKNTRHCVNSVSMDLPPGLSKKPFSRAGVSGGVEHLLQEMDGVLDVDSGFMGGTVNRPTYRQVVSGRTGHAERFAFDSIHEWFLSRPWPRCFWRSTTRPSSIVRGRTLALSTAQRSSTRTPTRRRSPSA